MWKLQVRCLSERPRVLLFMLAVMLPAIGLILVSVYHLRTIQRDKAIEAVIQRDYQRVLAIAEKRIVERAYETTEAARTKFPDVEHADELESFLETRPEIAHAFLWRGKGNLTFRSQSSQMDDSDYYQESKKLTSMYGTWFDLEANDLISKIKWIEAKEGHHLYFDVNWVPRGDKFQYQSYVIFIPKGATPAHPALAGFAYDVNYLRNTFFPEALNEVMPSQNQSDTPRSQPAQPALMIRTVKDQSPLAASPCWDGGPPEVERSFENVFHGLILGIKLPGTTIASIGDRFIRTNFLILGSLSLLLGGGIMVAYRNVSRELALARLKSDFVSNVSHELRTPLALIRLYAETLELGRISTQEKQQEYYEIIRKESERLTSLINNILDFSRIESGKKEYSFRETDVADLVRSTLESYRYEIEQNGFEFEQRIDNNLPAMWVDREAIARSLLNLVNNAVKYSTVQKYLGVHLYRHNGGVNLEVVDHGIGIAEKEQLKIFDKFYRVGDPLVHNTKGSGLGLSLVRHIVQAHGGVVAVQSAPGQGSKFIITLPLQHSDGQQMKEASA